MSGNTVVRLDERPDRSGYAWIPGNRGVWVGITHVFAEFAMPFTVYSVARAHFSAPFHAGTERLSHLSGTLITLLMTTASALPRQ